MVYIRHRDRMVQESVFNDLKDTLVACRWLAGTTGRPMVSPYDRDAGYQVITTAPNQVLKMAKGIAVTLVDYFPETTDPEGALGEPEKGHTPPNRMAMDDGQPGERVPLELGSTLCEQPYRFAIAFWGANVAICQAVMNDLRDRYLGNAVSYAAVPLFDYNTDPDVPALQMEVDNFSYVRSAEEEVEAYELTLYFAQLTVVDIVDDASVGVPLSVPEVFDPVDFRSVVFADGQFDVDPADVTFSETEGGSGIFAPDPDGPFTFVLFADPEDLVDGTFYGDVETMPATYPFLIFRITANDASAVSLAVAPAGSYIVLAMNMPVNHGTWEEESLGFLSLGLTLEFVGPGYRMVDHTATIEEVEGT